jgi:galactokinase/mevalonate kinase-like predicted kinase
LSQERIEQLQEKLVLIDTGIRRQGQALFQPMVERYCLRDRRTVQAIERNNALNHELAGALVEGDWPNFGKSMWAQWENWKALSEGKCSGQEIEELFAAAEPLVYGARMNGAGQGGAAILLAREGKKRELVRAVRSILTSSVAFHEWGPIL